MPTAHDASVCVLWRWVRIAFSDKPTPQPSAWAAESFKKATDKGVLDGSNPQGSVTREMLAVMLDRSGLL